MTTVRQDIDAKGDAAAQALLDLLRHGEASAPKPLPTALVVRLSTAEPSTAQGPDTGASLQ